MFNKILIANRGEIACRIIKTARQMGVRTVAVYSDADSNALHVQLADEAIYIGPSPSKQSYLQADKILQAALKTGAQAVHPGYGFLSENAEFARQCQQHQIEFIGPPINAIEAMGSKSNAKTIMQNAGVPLVPGYHGEEQSEAILKQHADAMGYPVLLKAAAGGGGKGMRQVWQAAEFSQALAAAKREAISSFADDKMLVEKYLTQPRHVEIQVFCDKQSNGVYLFERDCSVQRRHQKVIEEAPAPGLSQQTRQAMGEAALQAAASIGYVGAGTVEFLYDRDGSFYFMEMNTRLQVEHPVTEMITGVDLVAWQLRIAAGEALPLQQSQLQLRGHAFEARIYAEDPEHDFLPATGTLSLHQPPAESNHVRVDTGVRQGDEVSVFYDPMIAKLIVWDEDRTRALQRLAHALMEYRIKGVTTNINFLYNLCSHSAFASAGKEGSDFSTNFIEQHQTDLLQLARNSNKHNTALAALTTLLMQQTAAPANNSNDRYSPWNSKNSWRANEVHDQLITLNIAGQLQQVKVQQHNQGIDTQFIVNIDEQVFHCSGKLQQEILTAVINGHRISAVVHQDDNDYSVFTHQQAIHFSQISADMGSQGEDNSNNSFNAPMNGTVVGLQVDLNTPVEKGQTLLIMEAMKMEHSIKAPFSGKVTEFFFAEGDLVEGGSPLLAFEAIKTKVDKS